MRCASHQAGDQIAPLWLGSEQGIPAHPSTGWLCPTPPAGTAQNAPLRAEHHGWTKPMGPVRSQVPNMCWLNDDAKADPEVCGAASQGRRGRMHGAGRSAVAAAEGATSLMFACTFYMYT